ncbi:hypothetical protein CVIRNUC_006000 [Coccomyxa viridis]|uniref:Lysosomal Pro-X carboxypeptidase n=1 Tax=Coccomyxa viridis TaxID=1274662 RepID=A0AAV1I933_9CHLO|nr:hypothetical protein CVIRNUC_006000 [Coccomyxa viridis]
MKLLAVVMYATFAFCNYSSASADHNVSKKHSRPNVHDTSECWFDGQRLDHFTYTKRDERWRQRYLLHQDYWTRGGPIFFYVGNEANVEVYANYTGFMWESAKDFGALLVFAEHRYYGKSQPFGKDSLGKDPSFLSIEQALADYAALIYHLKEKLKAEGSPVIAFGGSYGGMLAAWLRAKYPNAVQGSIAASAPVRAFASRLNPSFNPSAFWEVVTYDASPAAGAAPACIQNTWTFFQSVMASREDAAWRAMVSDAFGTCRPLQGSAEVEDLAYWVQGAFDSFAMGNYPYPSSYMGGALPAWPMRAACERLASPRLSSYQLLQAMAEVAGLLYNSSGNVGCYNVTSLVGPAGPGATWEFQWCAQRAAQELPYFPATGRSDMFWYQGEYDEKRIQADCRKRFGISGDADWSVISLGGMDFSAASNIVFSNGEYDPWKIGGVREDISRTIIALEIKEGAHHLDLMWAEEDDPHSVRDAREIERQHIRRWLKEAFASLPQSRNAEVENA